MTDKPMIAISKNGVTVAPELFDLVLGYLRYVIDERRWTLDAYRRDHADEESQDGKVAETITSLESEIERVEALVRNVTVLRDRLHFIYNLNFEKFAQVYRNTRVELGLEKIEDVHELQVALSYTVEMLKSENRMFSVTQFITYINAER